LRIKYVRLYCDADGESHFSDEDAEVKLTNFAPPASPLFLSAYTSVTRFALLKAPSNWIGEWHSAPSRQFMIFLSQEVRITSSDGEKRGFLPGDVLLLEDTTGKGHFTETNAGLVAIIQLAEGAKLFT
jgi:hypothetical protein